MKLKNIIAFVALVTTFSACDDLFDPALENAQTIDQVFQNATSAQGILGYAYANLPFETKSATDIATDDAVSNNTSNDNGYRNMALGSWTSSNDPMSQWVARKATIQYLNIFLENVDEVLWSRTPHMQEMFKDHVRGEALVLRALNMYYLIRNHGGWVNGELYGVPVVNESEGPGTDFNKARSTFQACVQQIYDDLDAAIELLPLEYVELTSDSAVPAKYKAQGVEFAKDYNIVFGERMRGRVNGIIAKAIKAKTALLASSPAFADGTDVTSEEAANLAADVLDHIGGISGMDPKGHVWYMQKAEIESLGSGANPKEIIWRGNKNKGTEDYAFGISQEKDNFPPTLYGSGRINPSQNLVDAFPMADGTPINVAGSGYDQNKPYVGRDPRFYEYVLFDGCTFTTDSKGNPLTITTGSYGTDDNGLNKVGGKSTRTGYYLRKLLRDDCNPNPSSTNAQYHYPVYIRYTEIFLAYAEAANEAWGPTGKGSNAYSAYDVIKALHDRAGVGNDYLDSIMGDKNKMRELIRNERRIELCFENHRFWDMRRWKLNLNEGVKGMNVTQQSGVLKYNVIDVEDRNYKDYMYYGPIPYAEVQKWSNLDQNTGWN